MRLPFGRTILSRATGGKAARTNGLCDEHDDVATASLLAVWIDEEELRTWLAFEVTRVAELPTLP
jgi:starvation-inducible DNA-binding protein